MRAFQQTPYPAFHAVQRARGPHRPTSGLRASRRSGRPDSNATRVPDEVFGTIAEVLVFASRIADDTTGVNTSFKA